MWYLAHGRLQHAWRSSKDILEPAQGELRPRSDSVNRASARFDPDAAAWAIATAARHVPWRADCLIQAMAAQAWLRPHGYATGLHIGVKRGEHGEVSGHAWLTRDGRVIVGDAAGLQERFVPILQPDD